MTLNTTPESPDELFIYFNDPIKVSSGEFIAGLKEINVWYSWYNIEARYENNFIRYSNKKIAGTSEDYWEEIIFKDGMYEIDDINLKIKHYFGEGKCFEIFEDSITSRAVLSLPPEFKVDFSIGEMNELLGFEKRIYANVRTEKTGFVNPEEKDDKNTEFSAKYPSNITRSVDRILVHCSLIRGSYANIKNSKNPSSSDVIFSFVPNKDPGNMLVFKPNPINYFSINQSTSIHDIHFYLTDQLDRRIDLNNEPISIVFSLMNKRLKADVKITPE